MVTLYIINRNSATGKPLRWPLMHKNSPFTICSVDHDTKCMQPVTTGIIVCEIYLCVWEDLKILFILLKHSKIFKYRK